MAAAVEEEEKEEGGPQSQMCSSVGPLSSFRSLDPDTFPLLAFLPPDMRRPRVRADSCATKVQLVSERAGTHCSGHDGDQTTYLSARNSLLVCHAWDQSWEGTFARTRDAACAASLKIKPPYSSWQINVHIDFFNFVPS